MRIVRFLASDGRLLLADDLGDGRGEVLLDADGLLGTPQLAAAARSLLRGKHAVVADDDAVIRETLHQILGRYDCRCTICCNGDEARRAVESDRTLDLVVADIVMPHHTGYEVFAAAKRRRDPLPVLLITGFGYDPGHQLVAASREGLEGALFKPFTPQEFLSRITEALRDGSAGALVRSDERVRIGALATPLVPRDVFGLDDNFPSGDLDADAAPALFARPKNSLQAPYQPILLPPGGRLEPAGHLAIVIGTSARHVDVEHALDQVLGVTIATDVVDRRGAGNRSMLAGRAFDATCPLGPAIVPVTEIDGLATAHTVTRVNDTVVREGSLGTMRRSIAGVVAELSGMMTLEAGSVILAGAPAAVESVVLSPGDRVVVEIEGVGVLDNPVEEAAMPAAAVAPASAGDPE